MLKTHYEMTGSVPKSLTAIDESGDARVYAGQSLSGWTLRVYDHRFATEKSFDHSGPAIEAYSRIVSKLNELSLQEVAVAEASRVLWQKQSAFDKSRAELEQFLKGE